MISPTAEAIRPWDRIEAALQGQVLDRPAWSLWRHFWDRESSAEALAEAMLEWRRTYAFDFLKVNPRAHYHVEGWGVRYQYTGRREDRPLRVDYPVKCADDWLKLRALPPEQGALGEQLAALRLIGQELGGQVPYVETVFSPLMVAGYMAESDDQLRTYMREQPIAVHAALKTIVETFRPFVRLCLEAAASGIFFATTWASSKLTRQQYAEFGRPYDLQVLEALDGRAKFSILHVCGEQIFLDDLADYPVQAFSWASRTPNNPTLSDTADYLPGIMVGGLSHAALTAQSPDLAAEEARSALEERQGRPLILAPACSIPHDSRPENIRAAARAIGVQ